MSDKAYRVAHGWCNENIESFATFPEALAFYRTSGGVIYNADQVDGGEFDGETGREIVSDGLTEEEHELTL